MRLKIIYFFLFLFVLSSCGRKNIPAISGENSSNKTDAKSAPEAPFHAPEAKDDSEDLSSLLELSNDQKRQMERIQKNYGIKIEEIQNRNQIKRLDMIREIESLREKENSEIKQVLTAAQFKEYNKLKQKQSPGHGKMPGQ